MIFIGANRFANDIRNNLWKLNSYNFAGIIGIPRSGMIAATIIAEELNVGVCSFYEFFDNNGNDKVFNRHGVRQVNHIETDTYLVIDDTCCHGTMGDYVKNLREAFPEKMFVSAAVHIDGPCNLYEPDICLVDLRKDPNFYKEPRYIVLHYYNVLNNQFSSNVLYDLDGVICVNPPDDINTEAYERYLKSPIPLYIPATQPDKPINICTYRLSKYEQETRNFLKQYNVNVGQLIMFPAATREIRNMTSSAYYKAQHYKNTKYFLFIESNDFEAQEICRVSGKPVYCTETGRMYQMNK